MNVLTITGWVNCDPKVTILKTGSKVCEFNVSVKDDRRDSSGQYPTYYFRISCFGFIADFVQKYIHKDDFVCVSGKVTQHRFRDSVTGRAQYSFQVVADTVESGGRLGKRDNNAKTAEGQNHLLDYVNPNVESDSMYT